LTGYGSPEAADLRCELKMREKNFNTGLRGVLFEARHYERMGAALWLFGWLVLRQTHQSGSDGWVLGGAPVSYREIEEETGFQRKTIERWMRTLRNHGYIETDATQRGVVIRIKKAKKFAQPTLKNAGSARNFAGRAPQFSRRAGVKSPSNQTPPARIGSSSVARLNDKELLAQICTEVRQQLQNKHQNRSGLSESKNQPANPFQAWPHEKPQNYYYQSRERQRLLRAERDEEVRRELAVGTGPEVRRS
jgi:hypothetical protein